MRAGKGHAPVPPFAGRFAELEALLADPAGHLPHELYGPGKDGLNRQVRFGFPCTLTLVRASARLIGSIRDFDAAGRTNRMNYLDDYDTRLGPSAERQAIERQIAARFARLCQTSGKRCHSMFIPEAEQIFQIERNGEHDRVWMLLDLPEPLIPSDASVILAGLDDICGARVSAERRLGHYDAEGNRRLSNRAPPM